MASLLRLPLPTRKRSLYFILWHIHKYKRIKHTQKQKRENEKINPQKWKIILKDTSEV